MVYIYICIYILGVKHCRHFGLMVTKYLIVSINTKINKKNIDMLRPRFRNPILNQANRTFKCL